MSIIIANEGYREHIQKKCDISLRNYENDATEAEVPNEKIFEYRYFFCYEKGYVFKP